MGSAKTVALEVSLFILINEGDEKVGFLDLSCVIDWLRRSNCLWSR